MLLPWAGIYSTRARGDDGGGDDGDGWPQKPGWQTPTEAEQMQESFSWHECSTAAPAVKADSKLSIKRGTGDGKRFQSGTDTVTRGKQLRLVNRFPRGPLMTIQRRLESR
jgi:hypothetical protein